MPSRLGHILGRLRLLLRLGLAARRLRRSHAEADRLLARQALAGLFAEARGISMKVGQLFVRPGEPGELDRLVDGIEPVPFVRIRPVIEGELGRPLDEVFSRIDEAASAASLGQVHHALLLDGSAVAVKVRYPGIDSAVDAELRLVGLMPGMGPVRKWGFDLEGYRRALAANMERELDYRSEAARQVAFGEAVQVPGLIVPRVYRQWCGARVLVQQWLDGVGLVEAASWEQRERLQLGRILLQTLFRSVFEAGVLHADPNRGNYLFFRGGDGPQMALLDYGSTIDIVASRRLALLKLILALREGTEVQPLALFAAMGFNPAYLAHIDVELPAASRILFRPFLQDAPFDHRNWPINTDFERLLGERRWWFRSAGAPDILFVMRAFQGLLHHLDALDVRLPWWALLKQSVEPATLAAAAAFEPPAVPPELIAEVSSTAALARRLCVRVEEGETSILAADYPAEMALHLDELIPDTVLAELRGDPVKDPQRIAERVAANRLAPQTLFEHASGARRYRVWLE